MSELTLDQMKDLQEYLKTVITVETDVATQNRIIEQYHTFSLSREPSLIQVTDPPKPEYSDYVKHDTEGYTRLILLLGIPGMVFLIGFFLLIGEPSAFLARIALLVPGIVGVWWAIRLILEKKKFETEKSNEYNHYLKAIETYDAQCTKNKRLNNENSSRYHEEHSEWEENQRKNMEDLKQPLILTKTLLNELYKKDLIYKKYQNLPALTSIYEYLLTGRCDSLTGPHGAYNLYEDEVRKDTVISQLNEVINNLEKIRANQYMLYQQIKTIQENTAEIGLELSRIRSNTTNIMELTAINAYYSALTARNTEVTAAYHLLT